jgi:hypothetical protein
VSKLVSAPQCLGEQTEDSTFNFIWHTADRDGGSITRSTDGTISIYKDGGDTQSTTGIFNVEDFDSTAGIHLCTVVLTDSFYAAGSDYSIVLTGAVIDTISVDAVLAYFRINKSPLWTAAPAEITSMPAVNTNPIGMLKTLYTFLRNKRTQTSTTATLRNDDDDADIATSTVSDDATTNTRGEWT